MNRDLSEADLRALRVQLEGEPDHPDLEQELFLFVDGTLPPERQTRVEAHLASCSRCREDVADLEAVRPRPRARARRWPYAVAAALALAIAGGGSFLMLRDEAKDPAPVAAARPVPAPTPAPVPVVPHTAPLPDTRTASQPAQPSYSRREWETLVRSAREGSKLMMPAVLQTIRRGSDQLRGSASAVAALEPTGVVVETTRPTFTWPAREGARAVVSVFDGRREVARSEPRAEPRWKPNRDLARGVTYTWEVEVEKDGETEILPSPPVPQAQFRVLDAESLVELDQARREHADDHLLLGILYAKAGLDDRAREELQRVDPRDADTARRLLADIKTWDSSQ